MLIWVYSVLKPSCLNIYGKDGIFALFQYGDTALHTAARYGHAGVTRILISARAKMNEPNKVSNKVYCLQIA